VKCDVGAYFIGVVRFPNRGVYPDFLRDSRDFPDGSGQAATLKFVVCNKTHIALHDIFNQVEGIGHGYYEIGSDVYFFGNG